MFKVQNYTYRIQNTRTIIGIKVQLPKMMNPKTRTNINIDFTWLKQQKELRK